MLLSLRNTLFHLWDKAVRGAFYMEIYRRQRKSGKCLHSVTLLAFALLLFLRFKFVNISRTHRKKLSAFPRFIKHTKIILRITATDFKSAISPP